MDQTATLSKLIYRFGKIRIRIPAGFFAEIEILILKFIWNFTAPRIVKTNLEVLHFPISKLQQSENSGILVCLKDRHIYISMACN